MHENPSPHVRLTYDCLPEVQTPPDTMSSGNRCDADSRPVAIETKLCARGVW